MFYHQSPMNLPVSDRSTWPPHLPPGPLAPRPQVQVQQSSAAPQTFVIKQVEPDPPAQEVSNYTKVRRLRSFTRLGVNMRERCDLTSTHLTTFTSLCLYLTLPYLTFTSLYLYLTSPWSKGVKLSSLSASKAAAAVKLVHSISDGFQEPSN